MTDDVSCSRTRSAPPSNVGQYRLLRPLGRGGMADVYVGRHELIGRVAAIKILRENDAPDPRMRARFLNEARAVTTVQHPCIVTLYEFGETEDGAPYLAMELVDGEPMSHRLRECGRLGALEAVRLAEQIASALAAAHDKGVVHRDLKPSNLMLVPDPEGIGRERIKVLDFGIAKLFETPDVPRELTRTGAIIGTPTYMSPEQCRGTGQVDHRTDIYSLGVVLYRMVTGRPPFESDGAGEVLGQHLYVQPTSPGEIEPSVPAALDRLIMRCLAKAPEDRFATMSELPAALAEIRGTLEEDESIESLQSGCDGGDASKSATVYENPPGASRRVHSQASDAVVLEPDRGTRRASWLVAGSALAAAAVALVLVRPWTVATGVRGVPSAPEASGTDHRDAARGTTPAADRAPDPAPVITELDPSRAAQSSRGNPATEGNEDSATDIASKPKQRRPPPRAAPRRASPPPARPLPERTRHPEPQPDPPKPNRDLEDFEKPVF